MNKISGIYRIVCIKNGRYYYGSSNNIWHRWKYNHIPMLKKNKHINPIMQNCWNKHGENTFRIEIIELIPEECLLEIENVYLKEHVGKSNCMNIAEDANKPPYHGGKYHPFYGKHLSEEHKRKLSEANRGQLPWNTGKHHSKETRHKLRELNQGKNHPLFGTHRSEDTKKKMSIAHIGKQFSEEHKRKLSKARIGKHHSEETKIKIGKSNLGKHSKS